MAKTLLNSALKAIQGGIDNWIYRSLHGRVVISPRVAPVDPKTPGQLEVREQFRLAAAYARSTVPDAACQEAARENGWTTYVVQMADFLRPPEVVDINLTGYHGAVGDRIVVAAIDDLAVTAVNVVIRGANSAVLEQGAAVLTDGRWTYTATTARTSGQTVTIEATALDRPGHTGSHSETWTMP